ncbi:MAG: hypothetical protein D9V47_01340 [Clostridia bacterium]|nr:MAG: hypothetical protein D9V47_01340 [Clostridia bacterium]
MPTRFPWAERRGELNCLYPAYGRDGGNYTRIRLAGGEEVEYPKRIKTVVEEICRAFGTTSNALREVYGPLVNMKNHVPLPLAGDLVLVPVPVRQPQAGSDGALGYFVLDRYAECRPLPEPPDCPSLIVFQDGTGLPCRLHREAVEERRLKARLVAGEYERLHSRVPAAWSGVTNSGDAAGLPRLNGREPVLAFIGYGFPLPHGPAGSGE